MRTYFLIVLSIVCSVPAAAKERPPTTYSIPLPPKPDFSSMEWLAGDWTGKTAGHSPQGEIHLSVEFALDRRIMIFREEISLAATKTAPATHESWMGILSANRSSGGFLLNTFSSTGFSISYRVTVEGPEIHFSPEGGDELPPGWLFRRTIERTGDSEINETVQTAPPNRPFFDYYAATLARTAPH